MVCVEIPGADEVSVGDQDSTLTVSLSKFIMDIEPVSTTAYARFLNSIENVSKDILRG